MSSIDLGGVSPMGSRARLNWHRRLRHENPVTKVTGGMGGARLASGFFQRGAAAGGGGHPQRRHRRHGGGFYPYYPYYPSYYYPYCAYPYAYTYPYGYGYGYQQPTARETVPSACCYNVETGSLYCPGSQYDGAPAFAEATRMYQGRPMSYVTSPKLGQAQWFWNCPTQAEPSAIAPGGGPTPPPAPRRGRLRARNPLRAAASPPRSTAVSSLRGRPARPRICGWCIRWPGKDWGTRPCHAGGKTWIEICKPER